MNHLLAICPFCAAPSAPAASIVLNNPIVPFLKAIFEERHDIVQSETDKAFLFTKLSELNDKIVNFTIDKIEHPAEPVSDLKRQNLRNQIEKLYNAAIQAEQVVSEGQFFYLVT